MWPRKIFADLECIELKDLRLCSVAFGSVFAFCPARKAPRKTVLKKRTYIVTLYVTLFPRNRKARFAR